MWLSIVASRVDTACWAELAAEGEMLPLLPGLAARPCTLVLGPCWGGALCPLPFPLPLPLALPLPATCFTAGQGRGRDPRLSADCVENASSVMQLNEAHHAVMVMSQLCAMPAGSLMANLVRWAV